jgi:hypothetical protein
MVYNEPLVRRLALTESSVMCIAHLGSRLEGRFLVFESKGLQSCFFCGFLSGLRQEGQLQAVIVQNSAPSPRPLVYARSKSSELFCIRCEYPASDEGHAWFAMDVVVGICPLAPRSRPSRREVRLVTINHVLWNQDTVLLTLYGFPSGLKRKSL